MLKQKPSPRRLLGAFIRLNAEAQQRKGKVWNVPYRVWWGIVIAACVLGYILMGLAGVCLMYILMMKLDDIFIDPPT